MNEVVALRMEKIVAVVAANQLLLGIDHNLMMAFGVGAALDQGGEPAKYGVQNVRGDDVHGIDMRLSSSLEVLRSLVHDERFCMMVFHLRMG